MRREEILKLPPVVREFSNYLNTINDKSPGTINEYLLDLRTFFKYMKIVFGEASISSDSDLREIDISNIDIAFIKKIKITDVYEYFDYLSTERKKFHNSQHSTSGLSASTRARKVSSLKTFLSICKKHINWKKIPYPNWNFQKSFKTATLSYLRRKFKAS